MLRENAEKDPDDDRHEDEQILSEDLEDAFDIIMRSADTRKARRREAAGSPTRFPPGEEFFSLLSPPTFSLLSHVQRYSFSLLYTCLLFGFLGAPGGPRAGGVCLFGGGV